MVLKQLHKGIGKAVIAVLFTTSAWAQGQSGRYMVFFKQKLGASTLYDTAKPNAFLSQKSIDRRSRQDIAVTAEDFPVSPEHVAELTRLNVPVYYTLRWVNGALVEVEGNQLNAITALPSVSRIEYVAPPSTAIKQWPAVVETPPPDSSGSGLYNAVQLAMLGLDSMHANGVTGEGVSIAVLDNGFGGVNTITPFQHLFKDNRIAYTYDFVGRSANVFRNDHGTQVLAVMAANLPGVYVGGSPDATYQLYITEDNRSEYRVEEYNWMAAAECADSLGADIITSSLGYNRFDDEAMNYTKAQMDGKTAVVSQAAAKALSKGIVVVVSAGNEGNKSWQLIAAPADVDGALAVGSITNKYQWSLFSSTGPTADGRIKPDVVTLGSGVSAINTNGELVLKYGTSFAAPAIASLAAGLLQSFPEATSERLYELIINSGSQNTSPDNRLGYGVPSYYTRALLQDTLITAAYQSEEPIRNPFTMFSNPTTEDYIEIQLSASYLQSTTNQNGLLTLSIHDMFGRQVMVTTKRIDSTGTPIRYAIATLPPGLYLVNIQNGVGRLFTTLVKQ